ncbi:MAG TPA: EamA family transporter [Chitinophagaceae bacterium]|jgi:drug/metabolite transporter (DMT)-like permease|nr:EamA family transporter [Chitinophagaceae bacterium]
MKSATSAVEGSMDSAYVPESKVKTKAFIALGLVCFFWGTTWVVSRQGVLHMPALQFAAIRQLLGGFCYVVFFTVRGYRLPRGREWRTVIILSILNFVCSNGLSTWGVRYISAGLASIISAIFPLWLVVISLFTLKSKMPRKTLLGMLLGFSGICVIFYEHLKDFLVPEFRFGICLSLLATITWAFGTLYTKRQATEFNPYFSLGLQMVISGFILLSACNYTNNAIALSAIPWQSWASITFLIVFSSILCFVAYLYALQHLPTAQVSLYAYINPIVAIVISTSFFNEVVTPFMLLGGLITLYGIYLVNRSIAKII